MNTTSHLLRTMFIIAAVYGISSCSNKSADPNDPAAVADKQNDAKFDNKKLEKDAEFLVAAAALNLEEVSLGQLAQSKGTDPDVKALGKMMEEAHSKGLSKVAAMAQKRQVTVPMELTGEANNALAELNAKSGNDFDKAYCDKMVEAHKDAIAKYEEVLENSRDGDIKEFAAAELPELRKHLDHVFACQKKVEEKK